MDLSILKQLRKSKNIKQCDMAIKIGISQPYLSQIEKGFKIPTIDVVERICKELDCELRIIIKS